MVSEPAGRESRREGSAQAAAERACWASRDTIVQTSFCASTLLWISFFLMLYATISPYWMWMQWRGSANTFFTVASGAFQASYVSKAVPYPYYPYTLVGVQSNAWSAFNDSLCVGDLYIEIGVYGFCDNENGRAGQPSSITALQGLLITVSHHSRVFLFSVAVGMI